MLAADGVGSRPSQRRAAKPAMGSHGRFREKRCAASHQEVGMNRPRSARVASQRDRRRPPESRAARPRAVERGCRLPPTITLASDPRRPRTIHPDLLMARGAPLFPEPAVDPIAGFAARRWLGRDPTPSAASMATWSARLGHELRRRSPMGLERAGRKSRFHIRRFPCGRARSSDGPAEQRRAARAVARRSWLSRDASGPCRGDVLGGIGLPVHPGQVAASQKHDAARAIGHVARRLG